MAAIDRTAWNALVDDDGSNLVGTPWTKDKVKTVLLDPIDVSIAAAAQNGGAAQFTTVTASTGFAVGAGVATLTRPLAISVNQPAQVQQQLINTSADPAAYTETLIKTDGTVLNFGTEGAASSDAYGRNRAYILANSTTTPNLGIDFFASTNPAANATIRFHTSGSNAAAERLRITDAGATVFGALTVTTILASSLALGPAPATTGAIRLTNNTSIYFRNATGTGDQQAILFAADNAIYFGNTVRPLADAAYAFGAPALQWNAGYFVNLFAVSGISLGTNPAAAGMIRLPNSGYIYGRNVANTGDIFLAGVGVSNDTIYLGHPSSPMEIRATVALFPSGAVAIGTNPAQSGPLRLAYNSYITARESTNTADRRLIGFAQNVDLDADAAGVSFHGGRSLIICPADGNFEFHNRAGTLWASMAVGTVTINNTVSITAAAGMLTIGGDVASTGASGFRAPSAGGFYWPAKSFIASDADGRLTLTKSSGATGVLLDFATDAILKVRDRANAAYAAVLCGAITAAGDVQAADTGWFWWPTRGGMSAFGVNKIVLQNVAANTGVGLDFSFDGALKIRNRNHTADAQLFAATLQAQVISLPYAGNPTAANGEVRLSNNGYGVVFRNAANAADISGIWCSGANEVVVGAATASAVLIDAPVIRLRGPVSVGGSPYATTGTLRLPNGGNIYARNAANTADYRLLELTNGNIGRLGDPTLSIVVYGQLLMDTSALLSIQGPTMFYEMAAAPGAPGAGAVTVFARNTGGKTELIAYFNGGGVVRLAIQP